MYQKHRLNPPENILDCKQFLLVGKVKCMSKLLIIFHLRGISMKRSNYSQSTNILWKKKSLGRCLNPEICNKSHCPNLKQLSISHLNLIVPQTSEITITDRGESMTGETKANISKDNYFIDGRNCFITSTFSHWLAPLEAGAAPPFRFWDLA